MSPVLGQIGATLVVSVMGLGVLVTLLGHLAGVRRIVVIGILFIFAGTALMIFGGFPSAGDAPPAGQSSGN